MVAWTKVTSVKKKKKKIRLGYFPSRAEGYVIDSL